MTVNVSVETTPVTKPSKRTVIIGPDKIGPNSNPDYILGQLKLDVPKPVEGLKNQWGHPLLGRLLSCEVEIAPGVSIKAHALENYVFIEAGGSMYSYENPRLHTGQYEVVPVEPFVRAKVVGDSYHKTVERDVRTGAGNGYSWMGRTEKRQVIDSYGSGHHNHHDPAVAIPWNYLKIVVTLDDGATAEVECKFPRPDHGTVDLDALGPRRLSSVRSTDSTVSTSRGRRRSTTRRATTAMIGGRSRGGFSISSRSSRARQPCGSGSSACTRIARS
jgi:hypothetical protein